MKSFMFLDEVAAEFRTSASTIRHWIAIGRLRAYRPGRHILIARVDVEALIESSVWGPGRMPAKLQVVGEPKS